MDSNFSGSIFIGEGISDDTLVSLGIVDEADAESIIEPLGMVTPLYVFFSSFSLSIDESLSFPPIFPSPSPSPSPSSPSPSSSSSSSS